MTLDRRVEEYTPQYLAQSKIYTLPQRLACRLGLNTRESAADTLGKVTYSLVVGTGLDYVKAGLSFWGIVGSRATATILNTVTGGSYGKWREGWYRFTRTPEEPGVVRKTLVELCAFNTFEPYIYGVGVVAGSLFQNGDIDWWDVQSGMEGFITLSPLIGPGLGFWMDWTRKMFGVKTAAQMASGEY